MIYIATNIAGKGVKHITAFDNKKDLVSYFDDLTACSETTVFFSDCINTLCEKMYDTGVGFGSRSHFRVARNEAKQYIKWGASAVGCWNL
tara:strand:+ start:1003 stop:1272 length:270 start_codon:yes stop_codon:yes gene_type:complete